MLFQCVCVGGGGEDSGQLFNHMCRADKLENVGLEYGT